MDTTKITHYIRQHAEDKPTLANIAKACGYSPYHLSRRFRQVRGYTIKQYVEALKIQHSIEKLLNTSPAKTVTSCAIGAGYNSLTTFSRIFKQHTGSSPREYLRESLNAQNLLSGLRGYNAQFVHRQSAVTTPHRLTVRAVYPPGYRSDITFMGLFPTAIPKGEPVIWGGGGWFCGIYLHKYSTRNLLPAGVRGAFRGAPAKGAEPELPR